MNIIEKIPTIKKNMHKIKLYKSLYLKKHILAIWQYKVSKRTWKYCKIFFSLPTYRFWVQKSCKKVLLKVLKKVNLPKKVLKAYLFTQKKSQKKYFPSKKVLKKIYYSKKQLKKVTFHRNTQKRRKKGVLKVSLLKKVL